MIGMIAVTAAGRESAARLAAAWPNETRLYSEPAKQALPRAWAECGEIVSFLAVGATARLIAPLLESKWVDPAVVCVDQSAKYAVALVGGHAAGANALAARVAGVLGAETVITTATDAMGLPGLDALGWPAEGAVGAVSRALLDGEPVALNMDVTWPLPPLPVIPAGAAAVGHPASPGTSPLTPRPATPHGAAAEDQPPATPHGEIGPYRIVITDRVMKPDEFTVVLRPPSLVAGVGASSGVTAREVLYLLDDTLSIAGLSPACVTAIATVDAKASEPGIAEAARSRGWRLLTHPAARLAAIEVPSPSDAALAAVGTPSVAEAAALASSDELVVQKRKSAMATVAVGRIRPRGRLALIGIGPGSRDLLTPRAITELRRASVVVGLDAYLDQIRDLLRPGTRVLASGLGSEQARAETAVAQARQGHAVALVGSGDSGVYAMASPALSLAGGDIDVVEVPGITAALAAAAVLGAPFGHDHAVISLSDLHTPWEVIERRIRAAAEGDFVVAFYNPRSESRDWQLRAALRILAQHRAEDTPAGVVRDADRAGQRAVITTLSALDVDRVDMHCLVIVGSTSTRVVAGRMVTPRGYRWQSP